MITSGGKRKPANADRGMGARRHRVLMPEVLPLGALTENATVPDVP
jgi:hypothetical protein